MSNPQQATAWLFVPASRPDRFEGARTSGADMVIIDLEDAVAPEDKVAAREHARHFLDGDPRLSLRINAPDTEWYEADLALARERGCPVVLPKAESAAGVRDVSGTKAQTPVIALIETARGVARSETLATAAARLAFGNVDFAADIGVDPSDRPALAFARSSLVVASAAGGLPAPIDGVTLAIRDADAARSDAEQARRFGFGAKMCIHPAQLTPVREGLAPTEREISWAQRMITAGPGASAIAGEMVDRPAVTRARDVLRRAAAAGILPDTAT